MHRQTSYTLERGWNVQGNSGYGGTVRSPFYRVAVKETSRKALHASEPPVSPTSRLDAIESANGSVPSGDEISVHEKWLLERRRGIGGSDAAAICGASPFGGPMAVWLDKLNRLPLEEGKSDVLTWGHHLEDDVIKEFEKQSGLFVMDAQRSLWSAEVPFMRATLDGEVYSEQSGLPLGIFEGKTASGRSFDWGSSGDWERDVPMHVQIQVQHNMYVAGLSKAYVACLIASPAFRFAWWEIPADGEAIEQIIEIERAFWELVQKEVPPPPDASWGTLEAVKKAYAVNVKGKMVQLTGADMSIVRERMQVWREEKLVIQRRKRLDVEIMQRLGDAEFGEFEGATVVTWKGRTRTDVDTTTLKKEYPAAWESCTRQIALRTLIYRERAIDKVEGKGGI